MNVDSFFKCAMCVEVKYAKKSFKLITSRQAELLTLVHSKLTDFKNTGSKGEKRYYITFTDDRFRYTKVYVLRLKNEAEEMCLKY